MKGFRYGHRSATRLTALVLLAVVAIVGVMATSGGAQSAIKTTIISGQGTFDSSSASVSSDSRYVAFESGNDNLVPGDTNFTNDVFVRDRKTGTVERVSVRSNEGQVLEESGHPSISSDGRYVAFESGAPGLAAGDTNGKTDIIVRDRQLGTTERVSISNTEAQGIEESIAPSISADGRYVAFESINGNFAPGDTNFKSDVFVRDRTAGTTERVSVSSSEVQGIEESIAASISGNGRYVAFESGNDNMVPGDTNGTGDVFVRDRTAGTTERVSLRSTEAQGLDDSTHPSISADGRYVAFESSFPFGGGDTNFKGDIFVRDRTAGTTERVSVSSSEAEGKEESTHPSISPDGRYVAFQSKNDNFAPGDIGGKVDVFLRDRTAGTTQRSSVDNSGAEANGESYAPDVASDGTVVVFESFAPLVASDTNGKMDIYARGQDPTTITPTPPRVTTVTPAENGTAVPAATNVTATFSEAVRKGTVNTNNFALVKDGTATPVAATVTYDAASRTATLNPTADLAAGNYTATVKSVRDLEGTQLDQDPAATGNQPKTWTFTVGGTPPGDTTPPTVTAVTPDEDATAVSPTASATAAFSEDMRPASINVNTFTLVAQDTTTPVAATVTYDAATKTATLDPTAVLAPGTYTATVKIGARDQAGNQLDQDSATAGNQPKTWTFTVS